MFGLSFFSLFIDGAHTIDSLRHCVKWFNEQTVKPKCRRFLLFNITGNRDADEMLRVLTNDIKFDCAVFTPIVTQEYDLPNKEYIDLCAVHAMRWRKLTKNVRSCSMVYPSIMSALNSISHLCDGLELPIQVLVTGSLYMVGAVYKSIGLPNK